MNAPDKPIREFLSYARKVIRFYRLSRAKMYNFGKISHGKNITIGRDAEIYVPDKMVLGSDISFGSNLIIQTNLTVSDGVLISSRVSFIGNDHDLFRAKSAYFSGRLTAANIVIESGAFIGFGATILGNVRVGKGAIVGAHSLVLRNIPDNAVVTGVPARVIKFRDRDHG